MSSSDRPATLQAPDVTEACDPPSCDRFVDHGLLGKGGSAMVRDAFDTRLLRHVAIKRLTAQGTRAHARFLTEAQITAQLQHPHIVPVHEHGEDADGNVFMCMKRVSGRTLWARIVELGPRRLEPDALADLLGVLGQVCDAVAYAHSRGVIHRDLKPSNIMVGEFGQVYVMDWGIARLTPDAVARPVETTAELAAHTGVSGTPAYMAPEQGWDGEPPDPRIDVYSLGGLLYAILTGRAPHAGGFLRRFREPIVSPDELVEDGLVPTGLSRIAMKALSREPDDRYPDVRSFKAALLAFQNGTWQLPIRRAAKGEAIILEGESGDEAFVVVRGRCRVERSGVGLVGEIGPGGVFGELAVLTGRPRDATIRAATDVVLQIVNRDALNEGLGLQSWAGRFVQALAKRVVGLHSGEEPPE
ncbi:MAG: serine/threonine-protein kinase [Myxococcota bacterium]